MKYLSVKIYNGVKWTELNDGNRYVIEASSLNESTRSYRRQTVESPYIGGRFLVHAVADTVEETLAVYVYGQDLVDLDDNIARVIDLFTQFNYLLKVQTDSAITTYTCEMADYSVEKSRELIHNKMALVRLRVPRIPEYEREVDL